MQRIVSGEGINRLTKYPSFTPHQHHKEEAIATATSTNNCDEDEAMMSDSPSVAFDDAANANLVENDGDNDNDTDTDNDDVMMDLNDTTAYISESSMPSPQSQSESQQQGSLLVPSNDDDNSSNNITRSTASVANLHHHQTPLAIVSGLLPTVDSSTSMGSGLQRSRNASRDWGWFEDVHHSDQNVTGAVTTGGKNNGRTTTGGTVAASAGATGTSLQQQQQQGKSTRDSNTVQGAGSSNNNSTGGTNDETTNTRTSNDNNNEYDNNDNNNNNHTIEGGGDHQNTNTNNNNNNNNRLRGSGGGTINNNAASLLPTGDEMLIDEMQEYLEPILIRPRSRDMENEAAVQAVTAPNYVLEESLQNQLLWKHTAGNRPPQPVEERAFFEAMWAENFAASEVEYRMPAEVLTATTPVSLNPFADGHFGAGVIGSGGAGIGGGMGGAGGGAGSGNNHHDVANIVSSFVVPGGMSGSGVAGHPGQQHEHPDLPNHHRIVRSSSGSGRVLTVFAKGDNVFGTTVSKSFARPSVNGDLVSGVDTVNISVASYRVVESEKRGKHAQFLVIYREGSIRDTIGVWKRYSDFQELSKKVTKVHEGCASVIANMSPLAITEEHDVEHLPNAITSWHLLKKRKRWYRCLDSGYLSLKVFLLERFLHDILFESSTPDLLREFVGVPPPM